MRLLCFLNDGTIPDIRGNAPALVAQNLLQYCPDIERYSYAELEHYPVGLVTDPLYGTIHRESVGKAYRRIFQKITRLDPWPRWKRAAAFANSHMIDVVHAHQLEFPVSRFRRHLKNPRTPILVHMHVRRTFNETLGRADRYLAVSEYTRSLLTQKYGYPEDLTEVVYNGVDTRLFTPANQEEKSRIKKGLAIPDDSIVLSYIGRKISSKGYLAFLESAHALLPKFTGLYAIAAGMHPSDNKGDPLFARISELEKALSKDPRFLNMAAQPQSRLAEIYQCTDVLHFMTYFGDETFGMVAAEGMAAGCIVLASRHAALPELITHGTQGLLIEDPQDISSAIALTGQVIANLSGYEFLRRAARERAVEKFDWNISARKLRQIYEQEVQRAGV